MVAVLTDTTGAGVTITTGIPGDLIVGGDTLHILVTDTTAGSRTYTLSGNRNPATDGARFTFPIAANIDVMDACNGVVVAAGDGGALYISEDDGASFSVVPTDIATEITAVKYVDGRIWIASSGGYVAYSSNGGDSWTQVSISGLTSALTDLNFVGDDIGYVVGPGTKQFYSTWIGGLNMDEWTNDDQRLYGFPTDVTPRKVFMPHCSSGVLAANTVLVLGTNTAGDNVAYIGRAQTTGG